MKKAYEERFEKAYEEKFRRRYKEKATKILPSFFEEQPEKVTPEEWDQKQWALLAGQLQALIYESYDMTSGATIKPLTTLMKQARKQAKMLETKPIDPNEKPREISLKFRDRLRGLAQPELD